jgi:uncharacterized protein YggU (UPF0235/DUF167 family)
VKRAGSQTLSFVKPLRDVSLLRGEKGRQKTLAIRGSDEAAVRALCSALR